MTITPSCVDEPECNGVIERFMRTLKEQSDFIVRYNAEWLIERLCHRTPAGARMAMAAA